MPETTVRTAVIQSMIFDTLARVNQPAFAKISNVGSPLFMAYHENQPFNENHLRPCPMLENPQKLREMVAKTQAKSTDMQSPESADHLCSKCDEYAKNWTPSAEKLWNESHKK